MTMSLYSSVANICRRARHWLPLFAFLFAVQVTFAQSQQWAQWGGPDRNFKSESQGLATSWPSGGPHQIWSRDLGEGHSSIIVDGNRLYTMYRPAGLLSKIKRSEEEVVIAIDANTGKTIWEHRYPAPTAGLDFEYGAGPHATPLVVGNRIFTSGTNKQIHALDKQTGKVIWFHDLVKEFGAKPSGRGYTCSPIAYKNTVIVTAGGSEQSVMAFNQQDGKVAWKNQSFSLSPASPILINLEGQEQLVVFGGDEIVGLDPNNGGLLWSHPHKTEWGLNISTPVWGNDNLLFISSAYNSGSRLLQLAKTGGKTMVKELWFTNKMRVHIGTVIRIDDHVYGSSGDFGPAFITAVNLKTGKVAWQERGFARATFLYADGKFILLAEDGTLALATMTPTGMNVHAKAEVLNSIAWTVPTLVGTRLYLRDRKTMMALELGGK
jgi:outer membrane protein assembly factor BamB